jgi:DNA polymerase-4
MILHVDMDAFYAAVEQRDRPELRGKPVVVGGGSGRGVVAAASYEARRFGIHSAMPGRQAAQRCPDVVFVPSRIEHYAAVSRQVREIFQRYTRIEHYAAVSRQVREIFQRYTPLVQPLSLDEAFLDVTGSRRVHGDAETIGRAIKSAIKHELRLTASVGIAPLKFVAKIASDLRKPDGLVCVRRDEVLAFLDPLPIERLWGVGRVGKQKLHELGIKHIGDLRRRDADEIRNRFGSWGQHLWRLANGIDPRAVIPDHQAKQISHERTFGEDITDEETLHAVLSYLCEQVSRRLRRHRRMAKCVTIKYRRDDFRTYSQSKTLREPTDSTQVVMRVAAELLTAMSRKQPRPVRLIGVSLGSLRGDSVPRQLSLFDQASESSQHKLDQLADRLAHEIGPQAVHRATSHRWINRKR